MDLPPETEGKLLSLAPFGGQQWEEKQAPEELGVLTKGVLESWCILHKVAHDGGGWTQLQLLTRARLKCCRHCDGKFRRGLTLSYTACR